MRRHSWSLVAGFAITCSAAFAQQPAPPQPDPPAAVPQAAPQQPVQEQPAPRPGPEQGFFRPAPDPIINPPPSPFARGAPNTGNAQPGVISPDVANAFAAQVQAREALERELDRAQRENERVQAEVRRPAPMIVSPLDGTAPIVSPLGR